MNEATIRSHEARDLPDLVRIYNHYVTQTPITFDIEPFTAEERRAWLAEFSLSGPHRLLVAEQGGVTIGYASSGGFRPKPAYASSVETTIYLDPSAIGSGLGRRLYGSLLDILRDEPGVHRAVGGVTLPNPASMSKVM